MRKDVLECLGVWTEVANAQRVWCVFSSRFTAQIALFGQAQMIDDRRGEPLCVRGRGMRCERTCSSPESMVLSRRLGARRNPVSNSPITRRLALSTRIAAADVRRSDCWLFVH